MANFKNKMGEEDNPINAFNGKIVSSRQNGLGG